MAEENNIAEPWLSTKQVAEHLGIKLKTVRKWLKLNKKPSYGVGKLRKIRISEVDEWVLSRGAREE